MASRQVDALLAAAQFLTVLPVPTPRPTTPPDLGRAVSYFPAVGLLLGLLLVGLSRLLRGALPPGLAAILVLAVWEIATGAIHLDGFLDSCDGLFGGRTPEKRLEILRDHRVGAFAVTGGVLLLLARYSALAATPRPDQALLLAPLLGRWALSASIVDFPYARPVGLGRALKDHAHRPQLAAASITAVLGAWVIAGPLGLAALTLAVLVTALWALVVTRRLPGHTGDTYGAACELAETAVLVLLASKWAF